MLSLAATAVRSSFQFAESIRTDTSRIRASLRSITILLLVCQRVGVGLGTTSISHLTLITNKCCLDFDFLSGMLDDVWPA